MCYLVSIIASHADSNHLQLPVLLNRRSSDWIMMNCLCYLKYFDPLGMALDPHSLSFGSILWYYFQASHFIAYTLKQSCLLCLTILNFTSYGIRVRSIYALHPTHWNFLFHLLFSGLRRSAWCPWQICYLKVNLFLRWGNWCKLHKPSYKFQDDGDYFILLWFLQ